MLWPPALGCPHRPWERDSRLTIWLHDALPRCAPETMVRNASGKSSKRCRGWIRAGMWKDLTAQTPETKDTGAAGREPRHVDAHISWTRPAALGQGCHLNLVKLESVDPSFLDTDLSPPSSFHSMWLPWRTQIFLCHH